MEIEHYARPCLALLSLLLMGVAFVYNWSLRGEER